MTIDHRVEDLVSIPTVAVTSRATDESTLYAGWWDRTTSASGTAPGSRRPIGHTSGRVLSAPHVAHMRNKSSLSANTGCQSARSGSTPISEMQ